MVPPEPPGGRQHDDHTSALQRRAERGLERTLSSSTTARDATGNAVGAEGARHREAGGIVAPRELRHAHGEDAHAGHAGTPKRARAAHHEHEGLDARDESST